VQRLRAPALVVCLILGALFVPGSAAASTGVGHQWHRDNYGASHEVLSCVEGAHAWACLYGDTDNDQTLGVFTGRNITDEWSCPQWFESTICDPTILVAVYEGVATYLPSPGEGGHAAKIRELYVVTNVNGQDILYVYWLDSHVGPFYCPWFRTFQEALDAPFECTFQDQ